MAFKGETVIKARGDDLAVQIDALGRAWAIAAGLLGRYEISYAWDASLRRILIGALDVVPTFRDDAVQASVGCPLVDLTLQTGKAPVILTSIIRPPVLPGCVSGMIPITSLPASISTVPARRRGCYLPVAPAPSAPFSRWKARAISKKRGCLVSLLPPWPARHLW